MVLDMIGSDDFGKRRGASVKMFILLAIGSILTLMTTIAFVYMDSMEVAIIFGLASGLLLFSAISFGMYILMLELDRADNLEDVVAQEMERAEQRKNNDHEHHDEGGEHHEGGEHDEGGEHHEGGEHDEGDEHHEGGEHDEGGK